MAVFIDCGATWCAPGVKKIQSFKELHQQYELSGLKVIGLSFGSDPAEAESAYESQHVQWLLIHVPANGETRALWDQSARIQESSC